MSAGKRGSYYGCVQAFRMENFSKVARLVDEHGTAVILKNNVPRYLVIDFSTAEKSKIADTEDVQSISERLILQSMEAYGVLAK